MQLSDVVGRQDIASIFLASPQVLADLYGPVDPFNVKGKFTQWRFITLSIALPTYQECRTYLVGDRGSSAFGHSIHTTTSPVRKIDLTRGLVRTENSNYLIDLDSRGEGEPSIEQLASLCHTFHSWGLGDVLGIPCCAVFDTTTLSPSDS